MKISGPPASAESLSVYFGGSELSIRKANMGVQVLQQFVGPQQRVLKLRSFVTSSSFAFQPGRVFSSRVSEVNKA